MDQGESGKQQGQCEEYTKDGIGNGGVGTLSFKNKKYPRNRDREIERAGIYGDPSRR